MSIVSETAKERDMTQFTYDENLYSDLYKEVYGVRPRGGEWMTATPERKQEIWDQLCAAHEVAMDDYEREQNEGIDLFETLIQNTVNYGARTYADAVKWVTQTVPDYADDDPIGYLECEYNLPYGYLGAYR